MKVVIFCGGLGIRMGEATQRIPKPMIPIGNRPILWHIMKYYASWGHNEFILCLGYKAETIKQYFLTYNEALTNDFVLTNGGKNVELLQSDISDWRITFVDTRVTSTIGERLKLVEPFLGDDRVFLATYGDGLTDAPLDTILALFHERGKTGLFLSVRPTFSCHVVSVAEDGIVQRVADIRNADIWINGGYFVFNRNIFDQIRDGEELVDEPFERLIAEQELLAFPYEGFWAPMDTLKDKQYLETLVDSGRAPWQLKDEGLGVDPGDPE
jgi:glucose-1-phosphate cytidylyltransferase